MEIDGLSLLMDAVCAGHAATIQPGATVARSLQAGLKVFEISDADAERRNVMVSLAEDGMTMLCVTHEMGFARTVANRVIFMDKGEIVEQAAPNDFFDNPQNDRTKLFLSQILH